MGEMILCLGFDLSWFRDEEEGERQTKLRLAVCWYLVKLTTTCLGHFPDLLPQHLV